MLTVFYINDKLSPLTNTTNIKNPNKEHDCDISEHKE